MAAVSSVEPSSATRISHGGGSGSSAAIRRSSVGPMRAGLVVGGMTTERSIGGVMSRPRSRRRPIARRRGRRRRRRRRAGPAGARSSPDGRGCAGGIGLPSRSRCSARSLKARPDSTIGARGSRRIVEGARHVDGGVERRRGVPVPSGSEVERVGVRDGVAARRRRRRRATRPASTSGRAQSPQRPQRVRRTAGREQRLARGARAAAAAGARPAPR